LRYWWVNQNQTYKHEVRGGFLWSPKRNNGGGRNQFYDNMMLVRPGDVVLSFCDTMIKAVGIAQGPAVAAAKPEFGSAGSQWDNDGWLVPVEFEVADHPIRPKGFIDELQPHLATKYAPLQSTGNGNQGVYLAEVSAGFAQVILGKLGWSLAAAAVSEPVEAVHDNQDNEAEAAVRGRSDIGPTQQQTLVLARRGQGVFRANVRLNERGCRLTGITHPQYLVASHIKPWRDCTDQEKLDGCNGLLLSPHVDRLFDRGLISFQDDGRIIKSTHLSADVWTAWGFDAVATGGVFNAAQRVYLRHHRQEVLLR